MHVDERGADALADAGVCATLLPAAAFYLKLGRFAPARMLIDRGVAVALASDVNPGAGFSPSMPFAMTLACFAMQMTLEEALVAATLNAAWSLDRADDAGSLEPGKLMDAVIVNGGLAELLRVGAPAIRMVVKRGKVVSWSSHERTTNHQPSAAVSRWRSRTCIDAFSSTDAVPGGGSAAALAGAVGASLLMMVAGMPKTKTGAPEETADLAEASSRLHPLRDALLELVDRDSEAYRQVMTAFRLAKETEAEKAARETGDRRAMRAATEAPLDTMRACQQALRGAGVVARQRQPQDDERRRRRDRAAARGLRGARMNVEINLSTLDDAAYSSRVRTEALELERDAAVDAERRTRRSSLLTWRTAAATALASTALQR